MDNYSLDFSSYRLPFLDDSEGEESDTDFESLLEMLPNDAITLGRTTSEVVNWTSWKMEDLFFLLPLQGEEWNLALFRLSWDDNWGKWQWVADCRIKGEFSGYKMPALIMLKALFNHFQIDLSMPTNAAYKNLLNGIKRMPDKFL